MNALINVVRGLLCGALIFATGAALAQDRLHPAGVREVEFQDAGRTVALFLFYPAESGGRPFTMPFFTNLNLQEGAPLDLTGGKRPLVMLSHGRGSNALSYAWFAEYLAARGYIVAAINHYRANTYNSSIVYLANRLWQRPVDIGLAISFLLRDASLEPADRPGADRHRRPFAGRLHVAVDRRRPGECREVPRVPDRMAQQPHAARTSPPRAGDRSCAPRSTCATSVSRLPSPWPRASCRRFGMDEAGLRQMQIPAYITVGARDTQAPPGPNAEFAAKYIPRAELVVIPGLVDHEIFVNECNNEGRDEFPEACIDAAGVDRAAIHKSVGDAALKFFGKWLAPR